jgi:1-acyl-sn-glycerol-3-phosphate acyltransferase
MSLNPSAGAAMTADPHHDPPRVPLLQLAAELATVLTFWGVLAAEGALVAWLVALAVGALIGLAFWHPYRANGFVPYGLTLAFGGVLAAWLWGWCAVTGGVAGAGFGLTLGGLLNARVRGRAARVSPLWPAASVVLGAAIGLAPLVSGAGWEVIGGWYTLAALIALGPAVVFAWTRLFRPATEVAAEPLLWVMYAVRGTGPGFAAVPPTGPCLVIANHACWFDPLFLAKVFPRRVTPMMTARFFDLPVIGWLVRRFGVIRVPESGRKSGVPGEIQEAIAALDRGECVMIFPESFLRRIEARPLRRFARGVWQILGARPDTSVFACWIEGAWGSYVSYANGPPTKNKKPDFRRPIRIAVTGPVPIPADVLTEHLRTRVFLMNEVAAARKLLGLPELPPFELPEKDEAEGKTDDPRDQRSEIRGQ